MAQDPERTYRHFHVNEATQIGGMTESRYLLLKNKSLEKSPLQKKASHEEM
jgi:hypothetical protein